MVLAPREVTIFKPFQRRRKNVKDSGVNLDLYHFENPVSSINGWRGNFELSFHRRFLSSIFKFSKAGFSD